MLAGIAPLSTAAQPLPDQWTRLVGAFDGLLEKDRIVGGSIVLVQDGRVIDRHHYGFADKASGRRVDEDTLFHWASISKTLNAISVMQLRDHGMLSLDDSLTYYVPELRRMHNPHGSMDDITLGMLLEHSAGFQGPTWPYKHDKPWEPFEPTRWEQLVAMMPYQEIAFPPGSRFSYSNPSWIYLARILEEKTGDPWDAYIQKNIFAPLGMSRSYFRATPYHLRGDRSHHYTVEFDAAGKVTVVDEGPDFDPGITVPNGGWNSPLDDVAAYIGFLTGATHGQAETKRRFDAVLSRATVEEMWRPRQPLGSSRSSLQEDAMGLGFFIMGGGGHRVIGHTGGQGGFTSMMYFNPDSGRGVVAAFNTRRELQDPAQRKRSFNAIQSSVFELLR
jgi:CubicO group peptidase (beta-lactamase class C family)